MVQPETDSLPHLGQSSDFVWVVHITEVRWMARLAAHPQQTSGMLIWAAACTAGITNSSSVAKFPPSHEKNNNNGDMAKNKKGNKHQKTWAWNCSCRCDSCSVPVCLCGLRLHFELHGGSSPPGWLASPCRGDNTGLAWRDPSKGQEVGTGCKASQALRESDMAENPGPALHTAHAGMKDMQAVVPNQFFSPIRTHPILLLHCMRACTLLSLPNGSGGFSKWHTGMNTIPESRAGASQCR